MEQLHSPIQVNAHLASIINSKWAVLENGFLQKDLDEINREDPEIWGANTRLNDLKRSNATKNHLKTFPISLKLTTK